MKDFDFRIPDFRQAQTIDEIDDLLQGRFDNRPAAADDTETQNGALPEVLIAALRDRDIEVIRDPGLNSFEDPALTLQGMVLGQHEI
jgi:hypothetical protein